MVLLQITNTALLYELAFIAPRYSDLPFYEVKQVGADSPIEDQSQVEGKYITQGAGVW